MANIETASQLLTGKWCCLVGDDGQKVGVGSAGRDRVQEKREREGGRENLEGLQMC